MTQGELLRYLVDTLDDVGIDYMIVGSHASSHYGEPRFTQDVDVVVEMTPATLPALLERFPTADFYVSDEAARAAIAERSQFNIVTYDRLRFGRRHRCRSYQAKTHTLPDPRM